MKYSFSTLGCPDWTWQEILENSVKMGFTGIEVRGINGELEISKLEPFKKENIQDTKNILRDKKLEVCGFGSSSYFHDSEKYQEALEEAKKTLDVAESIGAKFIRVFANNLVESEENDVTINRIAKGIREACEYASEKEYKVNVLLEVHGDFNTVQTLKPLVEQLSDCQNFGLIWDIWHSEKGENNSYKKIYENFKDVIKHIHIKDSPMGENSDKLCLPGTGSLPIKEIVDLLNESGYKEFYSFEWEKIWHPYLEEAEIAFPAYIEYMDKIKNRRENNG